MPSTLTRRQFETGLQPLRPALVRYAVRLVANDDDAEDLTQACCLAALNILERFDADTGQVGLLNWLIAILRRLCLEHNRQVIARSELLLPPSALIHTIDAEHDTDSMTDDAEADSAERLQHVTLLVDAMALPERRLLVWKAWLQGGTQAEIATTLEISQPAVHYHLARIVTALRARPNELIGPADGYRSTVEMFKEHSRHAVYRRPTRRGSHHANQALRRLK